MMPCDQRERWRKTTLYGHQRSRSGPQRVYCRDCMSRSGPNISPPKSIAAVAAALSVRLPPLSPHAAANVGGASATVTRSCVFPEGISPAPSETLNPPLSTLPLLFLHSHARLFVTNL